MNALVISCCALALGLATATPAYADCNDRIGKLRELQADTPYLDPSRPDLERLRRVAQTMAEKGKESLCMDLVEELEETVRNHQQHASALKGMEKYAIPIPVSSYDKRLYSTRLTGMSIRNRVGDELGVVDSLMIRPDTGRVNAVIVEHGGFMGIGERRIKIGWNELQFTRDGSAVVLDLTEEQLKQLPAAE